MNVPAEVLPEGTEVMCDCGWSGKHAELVQIPARPQMTCPRCSGHPNLVVNRGKGKFTCACGWEGSDAEFVTWNPTEPQLDDVCPQCKGDPEETLTWVFDLDGEGTPRTCVVCGCTDEDCSQCIEASGEPCAWILHPNYDEQDICSRCALEAVRLVLALDKLTGPRVAGAVRLFDAGNEWRASLNEHHARGESAAEACENLEQYLAVIAERERRQMAASTLVANVEALQALSRNRSVCAMYSPDLKSWTVALGQVATASGATLDEAVANLAAAMAPPLPKGSLDGSD